MINKDNNLTEKVLTCACIQIYIDMILHVYIEKIVWIFRGKSQREFQNKIDSNFTCIVIVDFRYLAIWMKHNF